MDTTVFEMANTVIFKIILKGKKNHPEFAKDYSGNWMVSETTKYNLFVFNFSVWFQSTLQKLTPNKGNFGGYNDRRV